MNPAYTLRLIPTQSQLQEIFDYRSGHLIYKTGRHAGKRAGSFQPNGRRTVFVLGNNHSEHRIVWVLLNGPIPDGLEPDHEDRCPGNNTISNLRLATHAENTRNRGKRTTDTSSRYKGVSMHKPTGAWQAYVTFENKTKHLGYFSNQEDAATAYNFAAAKLHGEFASLNVVTQPWLESAI